jgi:hypothetical protein
MFAVTVAVGIIIIISPLDLKPVLPIGSETLLYQFSLSAEQALLLAFVPPLGLKYG